MYPYKWLGHDNLFKLEKAGTIEKELRPVFKEELDYFELNKIWTYPNTDKPLLWAEGIRRYVLNGELIAEAKGGGFYTKPIINVIKQNLTLTPVDTDELWNINKDLMGGLEETSRALIRKVFEEYKPKNFSFTVAFSGGKDSIALLELVQRELAPADFYVVFSDTGMELSCTYEAVENAKKKWPQLRFAIAKSRFKPEQTWDEFGPPGRRMRWCCAVHKSVPTIIKMRELTGNYNVKAVVFDGVRAEESARRAGYDEVSIGAKNNNQVNCSPILHWNAAELYLFELKNNLIINNAYRRGLFRVGCKVCPMSSDWWDGIANDLYYKEMESLLLRVESYAKNSKPEKEVKKYIEEGGWKARMGGRGLPHGGNRITEKIQNNSISFNFSIKTLNWKDVATILGPFVEFDKNTFKGIQIIDGKEFDFSISKDEKTISYSPYKKMDRFIISHLRGIANKVAYCIGCEACCVQCPTGAFNIEKNNKIFIKQDKCTHCYNCIAYTGGKGCLVAKSLWITGGTNMDLKGMNRYQHFGLRQNFLEKYFNNGVDCFSMAELGNRQYDALKVWLKESELYNPSGKGEKSGTPTVLFESLKPLGVYDPFIWSIIWTNLAYHSIICHWYMLNALHGETYEKGDLVAMLGDDFSESTRENAVTSLCETLRDSPIGGGLKQGIALSISSKQFKYLRKGWENPNPLSILYSLYRYAEETGSRTFSLNRAIEASRIEGAKGIDPCTIFGIDVDSMKEILQAIALQYGDYLKVSFQMGLDNIILVENVSGIDIVELYKKEKGKN